MVWSPGTPHKAQPFQSTFTSEILKHPVPRWNPKHREQSMSPLSGGVVHSLLKLKKKKFSLAGLNWEMIHDLHRIVSLPCARNLLQSMQNCQLCQRERVLGTQVHISGWSVLFTNILSGNQTAYPSRELLCQAASPLHHPGLKQLVF